MCDPVFTAFKENTYVQAMALPKEDANLGKILEIKPEGELPPSRYTCVFALPYLRRLPSGVVEIAEPPSRVIRVTLHFPVNYLHAADPHLYLKVVSMVNQDFVHPNVQGNVVCLGSAFAPGTPIGVLVRELREIFTYRNITLDERNALNPLACRLIRAHPHLLDQLIFRPSPRRTRSVAGSGDHR